MKNIFFTIIILPFLLTLSCCDKKSDKSNYKKSDKNNNSDKMQVYASIYPIYDFAQKIGGEKIEVYNITSAGAEPHDFEITSKDMANLSESDLFIYNGGEHWVNTVKDTLKDIKYLNASSGINDRINEENLDAHFWLSPINAKIQMGNIKNGLIEIDSNNKEYYESNYNIYSNLLDDLDKKIRNSLTDIKNRNLILTHPAFGYFCKEYNLNQIAVARDEADPKAMADIITFIKNNNVKAIFYEEFSSSKLVDSIIKETKIKALTLNPIESLSEYDINEGEDYFSIMEKNIEALTNGLN